MWTESIGSGPASTFSDEEHRQRTVDVLDALSFYRGAEAAMRRRARETVGLGQSDVSALRFVLRAQHDDRIVTAKDIANYLGISSASTTALLDRLEAGGRIERRQHPTDRRAIAIIATIPAGDQVRAMLQEVHPSMVEVAKSLDAQTAAAVVAFLTDMHHAVDTMSENLADH